MHSLAKYRVAALVLLMLGFATYFQRHTSAQHIKPAAAIQPSCVAPPSGMVAWWPGDGNANDIRGEHNGAMENVSFTSGKVGQAFSFTGLRGVVVPDSAIFNQQQFTIDAWFTATPFTCSNGPCAAFIAAKSGTDGQSGYELDIRENGVMHFYLNGGAGGAVVTSVGTFADGNFHHAAATYDGSMMSLYIDGAFNNSTPISTTVNYPAGSPFIIGGRELSGPTVPYPGKIDEPEFFSRALSFAEIQSIFNADSAGKCKPRCATPPTGMVSWWTGDDNPFDIQGTNHGSMPASGAGFGAGKVGRTFTFDGSQNPVAIPDNASLDVQNFTIDAWVFPTAVDGAEDIIVNKEVVVGSTDIIQYEMAIKGTSFPSPTTIPVGNLVVFVGGISGLPNDDQGWVDSFGKVPLNTWTHVAMTFDGSTLGIYVNGVLTRQINGLSGTIPTTNGPFRIGGRNTAVGYPGDSFNGSIDEVEFFNRALLSTEIQSINNAASAGKCKLCLAPPIGMVGWWTGDANTRDDSGNGNNGTLQGIQAGETPFAIGKVAQTFNLDGSDDYVRIPDAPALRPTNVTLDCWINISAIPSNGTFAILGKTLGSGVLDSYQVFYENGMLQGLISDANGFGPRLQFPFTPAVGTWYHIAYTFDDASDSQALYLNGALVATGTVTKSIDYDSHPLLIGADTENGVEGAFSLPGRIDEVEIFNRALSQTEIQSIVAAGVSGKCKRANTPTGANQSNQLGDATITFNNVTGVGTTTYQTLDTYQPGPMPFGYNSPLHVADISTTSTFTGGVHVCFNLQAVNDPPTFQQLRILHLEGNELVNRTSSVNFSTRTICADVPSLSPFVIAQNTAAPTAAPATISGLVTDSAGSPLAGVVISLHGASQRRTITDSNGRYAFENVETDNFYTLTPQRADYSFSPSDRSFSLNASKTDAVFTATSNSSTTNPLDTDMYFVRQQYLDFLGREPDQGGLQYWTGELEKCGTDANCISQRRIGVSAAFFTELEYQQTGSYVYRLYKGALGRRPSYEEFTTDRQRVVGGANLEANKAGFADDFVQRAEFTQKYSQAQSAETFVDDLLMSIRESSGIDLSAQRSTLVDKYNSGSSLNKSRSLALRQAVEDASFKSAEYNKSFVLMQYFGYLKRDPEQAGYDFWLNVLDNKEPNNYRGMVCSFITSAEYQQRFAAVVSHSNQECR